MGQGFRQDVVKYPESGMSRHLRDACCLKRGMEFQGREPGIGARARLNVQGVLMQDLGGRLGQKRSENGS